MKIKLLIILIVTILFSCNTSVNTIERLSIVKQTYPTAEINAISSYKFIIKTSHEIRYLFFGSPFVVEITQDVLLFTLDKE